MTKNDEFYLLVGLAVLIAAGGAVGIAMLKPRGIRNHNPGNLKELPGDVTRWLGERAGDDDPIFEEFTAPVYGIRALAITLLNYQRRYGLNTVAGIIRRFAPGTENDTASYINFVTGRLNVPATAALDVSARLGDLVRAIIQYENGQQPYTAATINQALAMAREQIA